MPRRFALWPSRVEGVIVVAVALAFVALDVLMNTFGPPTTGWAGPHAALVLQVALDLSLIGIFRFPKTVAALLVAGALALLYSAQVEPGLFAPTDPLSLSTVPTITPVICGPLMRVFDRRTALAVLGVLTVLASRPWDPSWAVTPFGLLSTALPAVITMYVEARKQLLKSLRDRAERAEREQQLLAEQARAAERRRLAAEMHDVVTHRLSLMVLQAGALGVVSKEEPVQTAAERIRVAGTQALDELRDLVGVLRDETVEGEVASRSGSDQEDRPDPAVLVAESASVGMPVELVVHGAADELSPTVARTAYRLVQEALTNARKHAPGGKVRVELDYRPDGVRVSVRNSAGTSAPDPVLAASGSGAGLLGLRQRVELIGGSLHTGRTPGGGFELGAILPAYVPTAESARHDPGSRRR
ncbi:sensor histidine kinase [Amycolatopsis nigrescens]|uniref:sensor histidine kinase n=1 Tax=Amycolatopsis nigrescens TaxID=381445 RepID=UPI000370929A|nr:histidine kinase [Amycolatopsis nigrescens]